MYVNYSDGTLEDEKFVWLCLQVEANCKHRVTDYQDITKLSNVFFLSPELPYSRFRASFELIIGQIFLNNFFIIC